MMNRAAAAAIPRGTDGILISRRSVPLGRKFVVVLATFTSASEIPMRASVIEPASERERERRRVSSMLTRHIVLQLFRAVLCAFSLFLRVERHEAHGATFSRREGISARAEEDILNVAENNLIPADYLRPKFDVCAIHLHHRDHHHHHHHHDRAARAGTSERMEPTTCNLLLVSVNNGDARSTTIRCSS